MWNTFQDKKFAVALRIQHNTDVNSFKSVLSMTHKLTDKDAQVLYDDLTFIVGEGVSLRFLFATL